MPCHEEFIPKWNIIFLIYAELVDFTTASTAKPDINEDNDDDVKAAYKKLESDLLRVTVSDNFNLFTVKNAVKIIDKTIVSDKTSVSLLVFDDNEKKNKQVSLLESSIENFAQKSKHIQHIFQHIDQAYPTDKNFLITWDHGSAFGIFKKVLTDNLAQQKSDDLFNKKFVQFTGERTGLVIVKNRKFDRWEAFFKTANTTPDALDNDGTNFDILSDDKLADAITYGFKNRCVETLLMFNCDMQNMHTCYALRNCVKYLVAPEGLIAAPGYDYVSIIDFIGKNKYLPVDGAMIAVQAVNTLQQNFLSENEKSIFDNVALFAVCLKEYDEKIIRCMKIFVEEFEKLTQKYPALIDEIVGTAKQCYLFGRDLNYDLLDIKNYLIALVQTLASDTALGFERTEFLILLLKLKEYLQTAYNSIIVAQVIGENIYFDSHGSFEQDEHIPPSGVTIYFPKAIDLTDNVVTKFLLPQAPFSSSLVSAISWLKFLADLHKKASQ